MNRFRLAAWLIGMSTWLVLSIGALVAPTAYAQTGQDQINAGLCTGADLQFTDNPTSSCAGGSDATQKFNSIIRTIINLLSAIVGIIAVIMIIIGGLRYITSGGSDASVTGAKNTILYAIIGLVVVALAQIIVRFVLNKVATS